MMCWSAEQVRACRLRDLIKEYEGKHLPWCSFKTPYETTECNCHNTNREEYLDHYLQSIIDRQEWERDTLNNTPITTPELRDAK